jgi:8-oxo-dGTP pyrophosphatase MutT (NUDIX family)
MLFCLPKADEGFVLLYLSINGIRMTENLTSEICQRLRDKLPGEKAHVIMAPAGNLPPKLAGTPGRAAVMILLFPHMGKLSVLLIKRAEYPGPHSGQISLPGGKSEKGESAVNTSLRESGEETGIITTSVEILGMLTPLYIPVSNIEVQPVVGYTGKTPDFDINAGEVDYIIIVPVEKLLAGNAERKYKTLVVRDQIIKAPGYLIGNEYIWGATAMILSEFIEIIKDLDLS